MSDHDHVETTEVDGGDQSTTAESGHTLADSPMTGTSDSTHTNSLLKTPDSHSGTSDQDTSRGSSLLAESPSNGEDWAPAPSPMDTTEYGSPQPLPGPQPLPSLGTVASAAAPAIHRPCSPPLWATASAASRRRSHHLRFFSVASASQPLRGARSFGRGTRNAPQPALGSSRTSNARTRGGRSSGIRGPSRQEFSSSRKEDWRDWNLDLPEVTPEGYTHYLAHLHPWAPLARPRRPRYANIPDDCVTSELPEDKYRPIPPAAYEAARWVRSLFPNFIKDPPSPSNKIPIMELQTLEAAIHFREESLSVIHDTLSGRYQEPVRENPQTPLKFYSSTLAPRPSNISQPVLYQVVAVGYGNGVLLEAKDFFVVGPDRRDLHCIVLDQYAVDVTTNMRGFDRSLVSVQDLVWIYSVTPTRAALQNPASILDRSRIPRATAMDPSSVYFFRADQFAFVTPHVQHQTSFGMVVHLVTRAGRVTKFLAVFEGAPEAAVITPSLCDRDLEPVYKYSLIRAETRVNTSYAMRFSEPPASQQARDELCQLVRRFLPLNSREGVLPLRVMNLRPEDKDWLTDRVNSFTSYATDTARAKHRMGQLFNVACSTLAALNTMFDDTAVHWVTCTQPQGTMCPVRLDFILEDMAQEAGWNRGRLLDFWLMGADHTIKMRVESVFFNMDSKQLSIRISGFTWNHEGLTNLIAKHGRHLRGERIVDGYVRLAKPPKSASPANEAISRMLHIVTQVETGTKGHRILDLVYRNPPALPATPRGSQAQFSIPDTFRLRNQYISLTSDQRTSLELGLANHPIAEIQAAFGTGKTVLGAIIAGLLVQHQKGPIIVTATTNNAVAHFATTMLALEEFRQLRLLRYISESAFLDESPSTTVDIHEVLKSLGEEFASTLRVNDRDRCARFRKGRLLYERYARDPAHSMDMTETEIEEYILAEKDVSECVKKVVNIMFDVRPPDVLLLTTASLLNTTAKGGIFRNHLADRKIIIIDEASQVPEPILASFITLFPEARQLYIGDVHQMRPYVKCPHEANPALFGGQSVMSILARSPAVPKAALVTTFRCHPALIELPNILSYGGSLISGVTASQRRLLLDRVRFPKADLPFAFIDIKGTSMQAPTHSYLNEEEARTCLTLLDHLLGCGLLPSQLCVVTFYREQFRLLVDFASERQVEIATVDSIQGRETEVIILLTTRTSLEPETAGFIDDLLRLNVAITRSRQGQFILGHVPTLRPLPHWGQIISWAEGSGAIVPSTQLRDLFSAP